jgi:hypothetical protein
MCLASRACRERSRTAWAPVLMTALACGVMSACGGTVPAPVVPPGRTAGATATSTSSATDPALESAGTIVGRVITDDQRKLVSGAVIMTPLPGNGLIVIPTEDVTIRPDGSFSFRNVPPGTYQIRAHGTTEPGGASLFATVNVAVKGRDISHVDLVLVPGASVTGKISVEPVSVLKPPLFRAVRVRATFLERSSIGDVVTSDVQPDGSFTLRGIMAGTHMITVEGLPYPWVLKNVWYRGQDITDAGLEAESGRQLEDVRVTVTDAASEVSGTVRDPHGAAVAGAVVLIIPLAEQFWTPTSRRFRLVRTDAGGHYRIRGLPAGEYRAAASLELDERDAYRPALLRGFREAGVPLTLGSLETRVLDLPLVSIAARHPVSTH